jgi:hypothetical protein
MLEAVDLAFCVCSDFHDREHVGAKQMCDDVTYSLATGWPSTVESNLRRKLGALVRHHAYRIKIGITNDPNRRWMEYYMPRKWRGMYVIYSSSSVQHTRELEGRIINWSEKSKLDYWCHNEIAGGGGRAALEGPYYLYIVYAPRYSRIVI